MTHRFFVVLFSLELAHVYAWFKSLAWIRRYALNQSLCFASLSDSFAQYTRDTVSHCMSFIDMRSILLLFAHVLPLLFANHLL